MQPEDPLADEIAGMVDALLEDRLGAADLHRLEELVCTNAEARRIYLRYIHLNCSIPPHLGVPSQPSLAGEQDSPSGEPADLNETLMMPALRAAPGDDDERERATLPPPAVVRRPGDGGAGIRPFVRYAAAAVVLIAATVAVAIWMNRGSQTTVSSGVAPPAPATTQPPPVAPPPSPAPTAPQPVAHLTALADAVIGGPALGPGAPLLPGQRLHLQRGAAEVTYTSGVRLLVEGPADVRITDAGAIALDRGKIAARVPHQSAGFRVTSSKLTVTDLGTEFGVDVKPDGVAVAHVFEGKITVALQAGSSASAADVRLLERDQTVQCRTSGGPIEAMPKPTDSFTRSIAQYTLPVPLHNTGAGAPEGSPDPYWQLVGDTNDPNLHPRRATVAGAYVSNVAGKPSYLPNSATSRWISTQGKLAPMPAGTYTFRTQFDLSGLDPSTATIHVHVAADDEVQHVRVNGRDVPLPLLGDAGHQYFCFHDFSLSQGFVEKTNTVEFDVLNSKEQMALRVEWDGTAKARVQR